MSLGPKVLVVDDKRYVRQLLVTALGLKGYEVLEARDGREALRLARAERPAVILLDLIMPGPDGLEVLAQLKALPETRAVPVVIMSARTDLDPLNLPPGAAACLFKPFDLDDLEEVVARYAGEPPAGAAEAAAGADGGPEPAGGGGGAVGAGAGAG